jgi:hypothetical protein
VSCSGFLVILIPVISKQPNLLGGGVYRLETAFTKWNFAMKKITKAISAIALISAFAAPALADGDTLNLFTGQSSGGGAGDIFDAFGPASNPRNVGANAANPMPPSSFGGQWYVTPAGCSYSRAQAPGYNVTWHLILNGAHVGLTDATRDCPVMLGSP